MCYSQMTCPKYESFEWKNDIEVVNANLMQTSHFSQEFIEINFMTHLKKLDDWKKKKTQALCNY